jgi:hypothetical protein
MYINIYRLYLCYSLGHMAPKLSESIESSSPIITRSVAANLRGKYCENFLIPPWQKVILELLSFFPQKLSRSVISRFQSLAGFPPDKLQNFSLSSIIAERLNDYAQLKDKFDCITLGSGLGGATSYLSTSLGGPFLPQAFVFSLRGGSKNGDAKEYLNRSLNQALRIAKKYPGIVTIQHFDPIHDGWLTKYVNHLRIKLISLPVEYKTFIHQHLKPGGSVVFLDCGAEWLRYRIGDNSYFQIGGWGDISAEEFLEGSQRIDEYCRQNRMKVSNWKLDDYPLEIGPESEWGAEAKLATETADFCLDAGYKFTRISLHHPHDFSKLAFETANYLIRVIGRKPAGVIVETFTQFDTQAAMRSSLLPLWLIFNTKDSLQFLKRMMVNFPTGKPVFFSPLATFSITPDIVPWEDWEKTLSKWEWKNIGTRASHYPSDPKVLIHWTDILRTWVKHHPQPIHGYITPEKLKSLSESIKQ